MLNGINVECRKEVLFAERRYAECHYAECHYAECHYDECHGAIMLFSHQKLDFYDRT